MNRMLRVALLAALVVLQVPAPARAQEASAPPQLHLTLSRRTQAAPPAPDPKIAEQDVERAISEIRASERRGELIREVTQGRFRRPDHDRDVWSGIQSRNLNDALRRR